MRSTVRLLRAGVRAMVSSLVIAVAMARAADPLPSWNEGASKRAIVAFVDTVTKAGSPGFVPDAERIAVFDNDGTLWAEQPMYFQLFFAMAQVRALAPQHPEWKTQEPFASILRGDVKRALAGGEKGILALLAATHTGMTTEEFSQSVAAWVDTARHPQTGRLFTGGINTPHAGCALEFLKGRKNELPAHVILPQPMGPTGGNLPHGQDAGFLGKAFDPFVLNADPSKKDFKVPDLLPPAEIGEARLQRRRELRESIDDRRVRGFIGFSQRRAVLFGIDAKIALIDGENALAGGARDALDRVEMITGVK